jgi:HSP20 family molecular chaperone IbpA
MNAARACGYTNNAAHRLAQEVERVFEKVTAKAAEYCAARGSVWGHEIDDWLLAERALIRKPPIRIRPNASALTIEMDLPDEPIPELTVQATEEKLLITSAPDGDGRQIFRLLTLPAQVHPDSMAVDLVGQALQIVVLKRN